MPGAVKACLYCAELIQDAAAKCRFCGEWIDPSKRPQWSAIEPVSPSTASLEATTVANGGRPGPSGPEASPALAVETPQVPDPAPVEATAQAPAPADAPPVPEPHADAVTPAPRSEAQAPASLAPAVVSPPPSAGWGPGVRRAPDWTPARGSDARQPPTGWSPPAWLADDAASHHFEYADPQQTLVEGGRTLKRTRPESPANTTDDPAAAGQASRELEKVAQRMQRIKASAAAIREAVELESTRQGQPDEPPPAPAPVQAADHGESGPAGPSGHEDQAPATERKAGRTKATTPPRAAKPVARPSQPPPQRTVVADPVLLAGEPSVVREDPPATPHKDKRAYGKDHAVELDDGKGDVIEPVQAHDEDRVATRKESPVRDDDLLELDEHDFAALEVAGAHDDRKAAKRAAAGQDDLDEDFEDEGAEDGDEDEDDAFSRFDEDEDGEDEDGEGEGFDDLAAYGAQAPASRNRLWIPLLAASGLGLGVLLFFALSFFRGDAGEDVVAETPEGEPSAMASAVGTVPAEPKAAAVQPPAGEEGGKPVQPEADAAETGTTVALTLPSVQVADPATQEQLDRIQGLYRRGGPSRLDEAKAILAEIVAKQPGLSQALVLLSVIQLEQRDKDASLETATRCTKIAPNEADCWLVLGALGESRFGERSREKAEREQHRGAAIFSFERYLALSPEGRYADDAEKALNRLR